MGRARARIREAFTEAYVKPDGSIYTGTQTVYAMALGMDLVSDPAKRDAVARKFVEKLAADNYHLRTGFLGTPVAAAGAHAHWTSGSRLPPSAQ